MTLNGGLLLAAARVGLLRQPICSAPSVFCSVPSVFCSANLRILKESDVCVVDPSKMRGRHSRLFRGVVCGRSTSVSHLWQISAVDHTYWLSIYRQSGVLTGKCCFWSVLPVSTIQGVNQRSSPVIASRIEVQLSAWASNNSDIVDSDDPSTLCHLIWRPDTPISSISITLPALT